MSRPTAPVPQPVRAPAPSPARPSDAFTLIELLIVVAIIAILAGLILQTAGAMQYKAAVSRAEAELAALSNALESYKADTGTYPTGTNTATTSTGNNNFLRAALSPATGKVYFEFTKGMTPSSGNPTNTNQPVLDPFGDAYGYQFPGATNRNGTSFFDLWSRAGKNDSNSWIKNW